MADKEERPDVPEGWSIVEPTSFTAWAMFCRNEGGSVWPSTRHAGMFHANQGNGECAYFDAFADAIRFVEWAHWKHPKGTWLPKTMSVAPEDIPHVERERLIARLSSEACAAHGCNVCAADGRGIGCMRSHEIDEVVRGVLATTRGGV